MKYKRMITKKCGWCGKEFETGRDNQFYCCTDCYNAKRTQTNRQYYWEKQEKKERPQARYVESLAEINEQARAAGMSYGRYLVERQYRRANG